jgi:hypothetical protein
MLTEEMKDQPNISIKHMKCLANPNQREVTFLYKLTPGACPKVKHLPILIHLTNITIHLELWYECC